MLNAIAEILPFGKRSNEWGDELYFEISLQDAARRDCDNNSKGRGHGFWPQGNALAIFFGPMPVSSGSDPMLVSAMNLVGRIFSDARVLKKSAGARNIRIEKA